jgi:foldase protein PrsA
MRELIAAAIAASLLAGCTGAEPAKAPSTSPAATTGPSPTSAATTSPAGGAVMATVNGRPVYMDQLNDLLMRSYGMAMAQQLIATELVNQAAAKENLAASDAEMKAEEEQTLLELFGPSIQADQREQLLEQLLTERRISTEQWKMILRRNVLLAKLAEAGITVTDQQLRQEFEEEYGRKVEVRHIQCESLTAAQEILKKLSDGADFAELARKQSTNATGRDGGLLPPIGANSPLVPPALRQAATAMTNVGEVSQPVQIGTTFHILRLERIIDPQEVRFEDVKDKLTAAVRRRAIRRSQQQILMDLIQSAQKEGRIQYVDAILKAKAAEAEQETPR